jgi:glycosyltransferase involved in cell wall biosynthesis
MNSAKPIRVLEMFMGFALEGPLGGAERFGIELCQALDKNEVQPIACGLWDFGTPYEQRWIDSLEKAGIPAFTTAVWNNKSSYLGFWLALNGLKRKLAGQQVDIIHSHTQFTDVAALIFRRILKARALIRTVHNEREWHKRPLRRLMLTNWVYPLTFDVEVGVSLQVVNNLNERPGARIKRKQAICIYNSVNVKRFENIKTDRVAKKGQLNLPEDGIIIGSVGRLYPQKGYSFLIKAAKHVCERVPQARFVIIGDGELANELTTLINDLDLTGKVILIGPRSDIESLFAIMDIFVSSSLWEGLPTVILESFAANVPVIATDVSGSRELIRSGYNGLLVPPQDIDKLAEAILQLLAQPTLALKMRQNAKTRLAEFTIPHVAHQYMWLYRKLASV